MARKSDAQNPLLTAVARKLGQAAGTLAKIDRILRETIPDPVGPEFMAPTQRPFTM